LTIKHPVFPIPSTSTSSNGFEQEGQQKQASKAFQQKGFKCKTGTRK